MIISFDAEKAFEKNPTFLHDKNPRESKNTGLFLSTKGSIQQAHNQHYAKCRKEWHFFTKISSKARCPLSPLLFNIVLEAVRYKWMESKITILSD